MSEQDSAPPPVLNGGSAHTINRKGARSRPIEIITRGERRRRWTPDQKRQIAIESLAADTSPTTVARKYGIGTGLLYGWRQELLRGAMAAVGDAPSGFVRVDLLPVPRHQESPTSVPAASPGLATPSSGPPCDLVDGRIEITLLNGVSVRVDARVDETALRRVLAALAKS